MSWFKNNRGAAATEFALVAPAFLMFIFLLLDGSRMLFTKQALNELAMATARCGALKSTQCANNATTQTWAQARAVSAGAGLLRGATATVTGPASCNGQSNMTQATITLNYKKGAMNLLPQSAPPSTMTSTYCFPAAT